jgi:hypothetical protein
MSTSINNLIVINNSFLKNIQSVSGTTLDLPDGYSYLIVNNTTGQIFSHFGGNIDSFFTNAKELYQPKLMDFSVNDNVGKITMNYCQQKMAPDCAMTGIVNIDNPQVSDVQNVLSMLNQNIEAVRSNTSVPMQQALFNSTYSIDGMINEQTIMGLPFFRFKKGSNVTVEVTNNTGFTYDWHWHGLNTPANVDGASQVVEFGNNDYVNGLDNHPYTINIPAITNQAGLNWVHAHPMYYSSAQLQMGIFGLIDIVDDITAPVAQDVFTYGDNHLMLWALDNDMNSDGSLDKRNLYVDNTRDNYLIMNGNAVFPWYAEQGTVPFTQTFLHTSTQNLVKISLFNVGLSWRPMYLGVCDVDGNIYNFYYVQSDDAYRNPVLTNIIDFAPANRGSIIVDVSQFPNNTAYLFMYNFDLTNQFNMAVDNNGNLVGNVAYANAGNGNNTPFPTPIPDPNNLNPDVPSHLQYPNLSYPNPNGRMGYVNSSVFVQIPGGKVPMPANLQVVSKKYFLKIVYNQVGLAQSLTSLITNMRKIIFGTEPNPSNPGSVSNYTYVNQLAVNTGYNINSTTFEKDAFTYPDTYIKYLNPNYFQNIPLIVGVPTRNFAFVSSTSENYTDVANISSNYTNYGASDFAGGNRILADMWNSQQLNRDVNGICTTDPNKGILNGWLASKSKYKPVDSSGNIILPTCLFKIAPTKTNDPQTSAENFSNLTMLSNDTLYVDIFDIVANPPTSNVNDPNNNYPYYSNKNYTYPGTTLGTTAFTSNNIVATVKIVFPVTPVTSKPLNIKQFVDLVNQLYSSATFVNPKTGSPVTLPGGITTLSQLVSFDWSYYAYYIPALVNASGMAAGTNTTYGFIQSVMMIHQSLTNRFICRFTGKWELLNFFGKLPGGMFMAPYSNTAPYNALAPPWVMNNMSMTGVNMMMYNNNALIADHVCNCTGGCSCGAGCNCLSMPNFPNVINYIITEINPFYGDPLNPWNNATGGSNNPNGGLMCNMNDIVTFALFPVDFKDPISGVDYATLPGNNNGTWKGLPDGFQNDDFMNFSVEQETSEKWLYRNWDSQDSHPFHFHLTSAYCDPNDTFNTSYTVADNNYSNLYTYAKDTYSIGSQTQLSFYLKFNTWNGTSYTDGKVIGNLGYMYHCHFMTHHDMMMMGQYFVVPVGTFSEYF